MKFTLKELHHASLCMFPETFQKLWEKHAPESKKKLGLVFSLDSARMGFMSFIAEYGENDEMLETLGKMIEEFNENYRQGRK